MSAAPARGALGAAVLLAVGVLAVSTGAVLARLAEAPPLAKAAWRCGVAAAALAALAGRDGARAVRSAPRGVVGLTLLAGALLAAHFATWLASLEHTSVATSLLLVNTIPVWVALLAPLVNADRAGPVALAGVALALAGGAWLAFAGGAPVPGTPTRGLLGPALATLGAWGAAGYFLCGRRVGARLPLVPYLALCYGTAALLLCGVALAAGVPLVGFPAATCGWLVALGLVPQLIGHSANNAALRRLPALLVSVPLLLEPVVGSLLAWLVLGEAPPARALPAGALVLLGVLLTAAPRRR